MLDYRQMKLATGLFLILAVSCFGCDKLKSLSDYLPFKKSTSKVQTTAPAAGEPANLLAKVGSWTLTLDEFNEKLKGLKEAVPDFNGEDLESKKLVLEELVRQELLIQDAESRGISQEKDIKEAVKEFKNTLLIREVVSKLTGSIEVTDAEAQDYYNQNKEAFADPTEWHVREIVVSTQDEAKEIQIQLLQGADFAATAQTRSKSASAASGGDLGFITEFKFPQMQSAVTALEVNNISSVFKGPDGYYIVKLEEKKGGQPKEFSEVQTDIKDGLTLIKQQQAVLKYIDELKAKTTVMTHEELLRE